jgi:hypothetical protein
MRRIKMDWITVIENVGFPITITLWFMFRTETVLKQNTEVLSRCCQVLEEIKK